MVEYKEDMPNSAVVHRLETLLVRKRAALPAPAANRIDAISAQLPLLESRLAETDMLDPLAIGNWIFDREAILTRLG